MRQAAVHDELDVAQAANVERLRDAHGVGDDAVAHVVAQLRRGIRGHRVAAVHAGALDVRHESRDDHRLPVADRIDVDLGAEEIPIDEHRATARTRIRRQRGHRRFQVALHRVAAVHDLHRPPAEHV